MVDEDRYCTDIMTQIGAVRAALSRVEKEHLRVHARIAPIGKHAMRALARRLCLTACSVTSPAYLLIDELNLLVDATAICFWRKADVGLVKSDYSAAEADRIVWFGGWRSASLA
jgi:hypothetical protein